MTDPAMANAGTVRDLEGRTALVAGAGRGIGRACALALAERGAAVAAVARTTSDLDEFAAELSREGAECLAIEADVAEADAAARIAYEAVAWKGAVDVLVNVAGIAIRKDPLDTTVEDWDLTLATNLRGPGLLSQEIGRGMLSGKGGSIVNITSVAGIVSSTRGSVTYAASKAALGHMTRVLAARWAPSVRVNAVAPGYVETELTAPFFADPENREFVLERTATGRLAQPAEIAEAVCFLASPAAGQITGQELRVDGGWNL